MGTIPQFINNVPQTIQKVGWIMDLKDLEWEAILRAASSVVQYRLLHCSNMQVALTTVTVDDG